MYSQKKAIVGVEIDEGELGGRHTGRHSRGQTESVARRLRQQTDCDRFRPITTFCGTLGEVNREHPLT